MKDTVESIVSPIQKGIEGIDSIFDTTYQILEGFQEPFFDAKQECEKINAQLRESLAKNGSLRKKDFDQMMQGFLVSQVEKETKIRELVSSYLAEQKEMINLLRGHLIKIKEALAKGEMMKVQESQALIGEVLIKRDERKQEVTSRLKEFQKEQQQVTHGLLGLLAKGRGLRIKDLKVMLKEFQDQRKERMIRQEERKKETLERREKVQHMLGEFKKKRMEVVK